MDVIDEAARRILSVKMWLGLFDHPYVTEEAMKRYEEGMSLLKALDGELKEYSRRLTVVRTGPEGEDREEAMEEPV